MRKTTLGVLAIVAVSIVGCKHGCDFKELNPCQSRNPAIVCIDSKTLQPSYNPVVIHSGQTAHFYITTGHGNLTIVCHTKEDIAEYPGSSGPHAWVTAKKVTERKEFKYSINVDGRVNDPEMVIEP